MPSVVVLNPQAMALGTGLATVALETAGVLAAIALLAAVLGLGRGHLPRLTVAAVAALAAALALSSVASSLSFLNGERKAAVGPGAGIEHCVDETGDQQILPFLTWLKERIPARATYWLANSPMLADAPGGIDPLCYALILLPRLPLSSPAGAHWVVYTGAFTPALKARIAAHDPTVDVFSPGYALVHVGAP
jgi:hypothetical protein